MAVTEQRPQRKRKAAPAKGPAAKPEDTTGTEYVVLAPSGAAEAWGEVARLRASLNGGVADVVRQYRKVLNEEFAKLEPAELVQALQAPPRRFKVVKAASWDAVESVAPTLKLV